MHCQVFTHHLELRGGILVYVSSNLAVDRIDELEFSGGENIWIRVNLPRYELFICTTYRPKACVNPYCSNLKFSVEKALDISPYVCILGDLNNISDHYAVVEFIQVPVYLSC